MKNESTIQPIHPAPLGKRMVQGAGVALLLIAFFLFKSGEPNPEWGKLWMIKPLLMVPVAGAMGGAFYYFMDYLRYQGGWKKLIATVLSLIGYIFALWIGTVLGLNGTMWN
ncbi:potassium transporter KefB [Spirosoma agri]|nr:potassium transporter KefB [Spirosoma agri]